MKLLKYALLLLTCVSSSVYADNLPNLKTTLTLVNESHETLVYTGFNNTNPETLFIVSPKVVLPGATVTITSISNDMNFADLSGDIHFQDNLGKDHLLHVTDPQQVHYTKPNFLMGDPKTLARVVNNHPQPLEPKFSLMSLT